MSNTNSQIVIGCLLDVSGSMRRNLDVENPSEPATDRLRAVLRTALKLAKSERQQNPNAFMFIGLFGLRTAEEGPTPPVVDLCGIADSLFRDQENHDSGHDLLIARANRNNLAHISRYIRSKLTSVEARIVDAHLRLHTTMVDEFVNAIPPESDVNSLYWSTQGGGVLAGAAIGMFTGGSGLLGAAGGLVLGSRTGAAIEDHQVERSEALALARRIQKQWLLEFARLNPRPVSDVVNTLERFHHDIEVDDGENLHDILRQYIFGSTPMCCALNEALEAFRSRQDAGHRVLVLISDGHSTDGDPTVLADKFRSENIWIATVNLTEDKDSPQRALYYEAETSWNPGTQALFTLATRVPASRHPIPVLASIGWRVPSAGEIALFSSVCSATALDEFCSLLLSARFGSADALLDIIGRIHFDDYIDNAHLNVRRQPSNQGEAGVCYAHATASVVHMALLRIVCRDGGVPSLDQIRTRILTRFPETVEGRYVDEVLTQACKWYRPLQFHEVDEDQARQAVLRRRPVLATFQLSELGWEEFCSHFDDSARRHCVLTNDQMKPHYEGEEDGGHAVVLVGHAVVLVGCSPNSLTFLNSWGSTWGSNGSFIIESSRVLAHKDTPMRFYDVYWLESNLTTAEQQAYDNRVDEELRRHVNEYPGIFSLEYQCPRCQQNAPLAQFRGSVRRAICPNREERFDPEPGRLVEALYLRAGLNDVT